MNSKTISKQRQRKTRGPSMFASTARFTVLRPRHELLVSEESASTLKNINRARKVLLEFAQKHIVRDPEEVGQQSSVFILNLLATYCNMGNPNALGDDSMAALIQGLWHVYEEKGHFQNWVVDDETKKARGNPLKGNADIDALRKAHRVHLSRYGSVALCARPITASQVCTHAAEFWFGCKENEKYDIIPDPRNVQLHAILCLGLNLGLRYDEIAKLSMQHFSMDSGKITLTINQKIKNSTEQRIYEVRDWPGSSVLRSSLYTDPFVALLSWVKMRGVTDGPIFCDIKKSQTGFRINQGVVRSSSKFTPFLRERLKAIGVASADVKMYSRHSIKRRCVQLYRSLNVRDEQIMEIIQMKGHNAYCNYTAAYNDFAPSDLPRFTSVQDYMLHAEQLKKEFGISEELSVYQSSIEEISKMF